MQYVDDLEAQASRDADKALELAREFLYQVKDLAPQDRRDVTDMMRYYRTRSQRAYQQARSYRGHDIPAWQD